MTDTGSLEPSPEALAWQRRADAWAQQAESDESQAVEPANRWSEVASTGRTAFPADGVGWRTETAEWRATGAARWRQTTEWRSTTGSHGWRSTTEAWQTNGNGEYVPPVTTPTEQPAISSTAWSAPAESDPPRGTTTPSWQQPAESRPSWQQFADPATSWQQPSRQQPSRQQPTPRPPAESSPSWQQLVEPTKPGGTIDGSATWTDNGNTGASNSDAWLRTEPETPSWQTPRREPETPSWQTPSWQTPRSEPETPSWQTPRDDGRHLVREDDRAAWRREADLGENSRPIGRRRAPEPGSRTSGGVGWAAREESDNWAGHADTGSIQLYPEPETPTWGARSEAPPPRGYGEPTGRRALPASGYDETTARRGDPATTGRHDASLDGRRALPAGSFGEDATARRYAAGLADLSDTDNDRSARRGRYPTDDDTGRGYSGAAPTSGYAPNGRAATPRADFASPDQGSGFDTSGRASGFGSAGQASGFGAPGQASSFASAAPASGLGSPGPASGRGSAGPASGYGSAGPASGYGSAAAPTSGYAPNGRAATDGPPAAAPTSGYAPGGRRRSARYADEEAPRPGGPIDDPRYVDGAASAGRSAPARGGQDREAYADQPPRRNPAAARKARYNQVHDDWREHTGSWSAEPDTSSWTRDPDTGQWSRSQDDPRVLAWREEAARREDAHQSAARRELPAAPADEQNRASWSQRGGAGWAGAAPGSAVPDDGQRRGMPDDDRGGMGPGPASRAAMPAAPRSAMPDDSRSRRGMPDGPIPRSAMPDDTMPRRGMPDGPAPRNAMPDDSRSRRGMPDGPIPRSAMPDDSRSRRGMPDGPIPRSAMPDDSRSRRGMADGAIPRSAMPDDTMPRRGMPDEGLPRRGIDDGPVPRSAMPDDSRSRRGIADGPTPRSAMPDDTMPRRGMPDDAASARWGQDVDAPGRRGQDDPGAGRWGQDDPGPGRWGQDDPAPRRSRRDDSRRDRDDDPRGGFNPRDAYEDDTRGGYGMRGGYDDEPGPRRGVADGPISRSAMPASPRRALPGPDSDPRGIAPQSGIPGGRRALPSSADPRSAMPAIDAPAGPIPGGGTYGGASYRGDGYRDDPYGDSDGRRRAGESMAGGRRAAADPALDAARSSDAWRRDLDPEAAARQPRALAGYDDPDEWRASAAARSGPETDFEDRSWPPRGGASRPARQPAEPNDWQRAEREEAARGHAPYREGGSDDWRRDLAEESDLAEGESRRYGTSDFVPFRSSGSAAVPGASNLSMTSTSMIMPAGGPDPMSVRPQRAAASNGYLAPGGSYERRPVGGGFTSGRRSSDLLDPDDEEDDQASGGPLAAVGYTVIWYGVPVVLFILYMLIGGSQSHALDTAAKAAPQFAISLVLSVMVAVGIRWASSSWKAISVGLAAAVVGGGLATVLSSAITGNSLS